jgi:hypothetical protein
MAYSTVQLKFVGININLFRLLEVEKGEGTLFSFGCEMSAITQHFRKMESNVCDDTLTYTLLESSACELLDCLYDTCTYIVTYRMQMIKTAVPVLRPKLVV